MDFATQKVRDIKHVPVVTGSPRQRAVKAEEDAMAFARDIRHYDPRQLWGRANYLLETNPVRLIAALVHLAARADPRPPAWVEELGGLAALHPDYDPARHRKAPAVRKPGPNDEAVLTLARKGITDAEIARRLGLRRQAVNAIRGHYGLPDRTREAIARRDAFIAELSADHVSTKDIGATVGLSVRAVERALRRIADAAENGKTAESTE